MGGAWARDLQSVRFLQAGQVDCPAGPGGLVDGEQHLHRLDVVMAAAGGFLAASAAVGEVQDLVGEEVGGRLIRLDGRKRIEDDGNSFRKVVIVAASRFRRG